MVALEGLLLMRKQASDCLKWLLILAMGLNCSGLVQRLTYSIETDAAELGRTRPVEAEHMLQRMEQRMLDVEQSVKMSGRILVSSCCTAVCSVLEMNVLVVQGELIS